VSIAEHAEKALGATTTTGGGGGAARGLAGVHGIVERWT